MYRQLLVPVDGSAAANAGLQEAIRLAGNSKAVIHLVHVIDRLSFLQSLQPVQIIEEILVQMERAGRDILASARSQVARARVPVEAVIRKPEKGSVADTLIKEAQRAKVDLIVMGTHHTQNPWRVILKDTASGVVRHCACPVLLVPPQSTQRRPTRPRPQTASSAGNAA